MNAYDLAALRDLGIDVGSLGCVMLDVDAPTPVAEVIPEKWAYHSSHPSLGHVTGIQSEHHVTLLYGLLPQVRRRHVDEVLDATWTGRNVQVRTDSLTVFDPPIPDEPYSCIVAKQHQPSREIADAHARLSLLPHINTHPEFKAHVTLAYVKRERAHDALRELHRALDPEADGSGMVSARFRPTALNYGDAISDEDS